MTPRARQLITAWEAGQGMKIKAARPLAVYGACSSFARRLADSLPPEYTRLLLTQDQIDDCEQRAVTSARNVRFGPAKTEEEWREQCALIRADWTTPTTKQEAA